jgi:hypothetical protein
VLGRVKPILDRFVQIDNAQAVLPLLRPCLSILQVFPPVRPERHVDLAKAEGLLKHRLVKLPRECQAVTLPVPRHLGRGRERTFVVIKERLVVIASGAPFLVKCKCQVVRQAIRERGRLGLVQVE